MGVSHSEPLIVCLCGSTRFQKEFFQALKEETLKGRIVLTTTMTGHDDRFFNGWSVDERMQKQLMLEGLHMRKVEMADEVLVMDVNGYIGSSTKREVLYAQALKKKIRWWSLELQSNQRNTKI